MMLGLRMNEDVATNNITKCQSEIQQSRSKILRLAQDVDYGSFLEVMITQKIASEQYPLGFGVSFDAASGRYFVSAIENFHPDLKIGSEVVLLGNYPVKDFEHGQLENILNTAKPPFSITFYNSKYDYV